MGKHHRCLWRKRRKNRHKPSFFWIKNSAKTWIMHRNRRIINFQNLNTSFLSTQIWAMSIKWWSRLDIANMEKMVSIWLIATVSQITITKALSFSDTYMSEASKKTPITLLSNLACLCKMVQLSVRLRRIRLMQIFLQTIFRKNTWLDKLMLYFLPMRQEALWHLLESLVQLSSSKANTATNSWWILRKRC